MPESRVTILVSGRVQGVGFRFFTAEAARRLDLCGTVRNLPDGGVEVVAEGERARLEALVAAVRRGPSAARVDDLITVYGAPVGGPAAHGLPRPFQITG